MNSISKIVKKAIKNVKNSKPTSCFSFKLCSPSIQNQFDSMLKLFDDEIGKLDLVKIDAFVSDIIEVFCYFTFIDLNDINKIESLSKSIETKVNTLSVSLVSILGDRIPAVERDSKWGRLKIIEKIRTNLSNFESESTIINRLIISFDSLFKEIEIINNTNFTTSKTNPKNLIDLMTLCDVYVDVIKEKKHPLLQTQIDDLNLSSLEQVNRIGRFFQHLDTILSYGILTFKNEYQVLNALLDQVDECTRILRKYSQLHLLYKIIYGNSYLSKLNDIIHNVVSILDNSNLKLNSAEEFTIELQDKYSKLLIKAIELNNQEKITILRDHFKIKFPDILNINLLKNPCGDDYFKYWHSTQVNYEYLETETVIRDYKENINKPNELEWKIEKDHVGCDELLDENSKVLKNFATSYNWADKMQLIEFDQSTLDFIEKCIDINLDIKLEVNENYAARCDCGSIYKLNVYLVNDEYQIIDSYLFTDEMPQFTGGKWKLASNLFDVKKPFKYIIYYHGGQDSHYWAGFFGSKMTNGSVRLLLNTN